VVSPVNNPTSNYFTVTLLNALIQQRQPRPDMEIKVICDCGTKYKFEVTPTHGRMPFSVTCPACGADGTAKANEFLQQSQPAGEPAPLVAPAPEIVMSPNPGYAPCPVSAAPSAPPPPPPVATPAGLRINRPAPAPMAHVPPPAMPAPILPPPLAQSREPKSSGALAGTVTAVIVLLALGLGVWKFGSKWYRRISAAVEVAKDISAATSGASEHYNFDDEAVVALYVKHGNHTEVASVCKDFWRDKFRKNMTIVPLGPDGEYDEHDYAIHASYNGWVRIFGNDNWKPAEFEELSQHLSQQFSNLVFEVGDVGTFTYHFGVYEAGARKFHIVHEVKIKGDNVEDNVKTEGDAWALAHGFKPDEEGFKGFTEEDADKISQNLGMKLWDEPENKKIVGLVLKEAGK